MKKEFKINNNIVEIEVEEKLSDSTKITIIHQLEYQVVSREFGYVQPFIDPMFKALVIFHATSIDVTAIDFDKLTAFLEANKEVVEEIINHIDPDGSLYNSCIEAIDWRKYNFIALQISDLVKVIQPFAIMAETLTKITNENVVTDEVIDKLKDFADAIKDVDTVDVAKMLVGKGDN